MCRPLYVPEQKYYVCLYVSASGSVYVRFYASDTDLITSTTSSPAACITGGGFYKSGFIYTVFLVVNGPSYEYHLLRVNCTTWAVTDLGKCSTNFGYISGNDTFYCFLCFDGTDTVYLASSQRISTSPFNSFICVDKFVISTTTLTALGSTSITNVTSFHLDGICDSYVYFHASRGLTLYAKMVSIGGGAFVDVDGKFPLGSGYHTHGGHVVYSTGDAASWDLTYTPRRLCVIPDTTPKFILHDELNNFIRYFDGTTLKASVSVAYNIFNTGAWFDPPDNCLIRTDGALDYGALGLDPLFTEGRDVT
jgi:hypothetical protein